MSGQNDLVELRIVVPRTHLPMTAPPDFYSQVNCGLLGLPKRTYLELLRRPDAPPVTRVGKLRLVARDDMIAYIQRLREVAPKAVAELDDAERLLLEMGCAPRVRARKAG